MRREILEVSFQKGLGDFLQELQGVTINGGYLENTIKTWPRNGITIVNPPTNRTPCDPTNGCPTRLQLSNDRPSGVRALLFLLYGSGPSIATNTIAGFLTESKDSGSKWAVAGRSRGGGGGRRRNRKTRRKKRKERKSKRKVIKKQRKSIHRKRKKRKSKNRRRKY